jgi:hypothetical protein
MGNKPAGCNSQQPIQALLEDAISALRERPGSTQSDIIKYLESKYDKSIPTKTKEKLLDRLKPILKASKMEYNRGNNHRGANQGGGGRAAQGLGKRKGGGIAAAAKTGRRACRSRTSQTNHRGNKSRCKSRASSSQPKKLNGSRSMKRKVGGSTCIKQGGRISSSNNARRRNKMEPRSRIIKSNHGRTGPQSGTKFALYKYQTRAAPRYNNYTYNNAHKKKIGRRGRPTGHFSKMDSSSIFPCIDISGNHHENN